MFKRYLIPHKGNDYHPHFFRNTVIGFIALCGLILLLISLIGSTTLKNNGLLGAIYASVLVDLTNQDRVASSLSTLSINDSLTKAADYKADDMITKGYFAHTSPEGVSPWFWIIKAGYKFAYAGENLAVNFNESTEVENAWMNSPAHRANILNNRFSEVGIAVKEGQFQGKDVIFVVQMFGKPTKPQAVKNTQTVTNIAAAPALLSDSSLPQVAEVKGAELEITSESKDPSGTNLFIAVKDPTSTDLENEITTQAKPQTSNIWNKLVMRFPIALNVIYAVLSLIVFFGTVMLIIVEIKHRKPKLILLGFVILILLSGAMYMNSSTTLFALSRTLY